MLWMCAVISCVCGQQEFTPPLVTASVGAKTAEDTRYVTDFREYLGAAVARYGDWDLDGRDDFLVSAPRGWPKERDGTDGAGRVFLVSGRNGQVLLSLRGSQKWFGTSVSSLGDLNRDGWRDVLIESDQGSAVLVSGRDGSLLRSVGLSDDKGRIRVRAIRDVDGDGVNELACIDSQAVYLESGASGARVGVALSIKSLELVQVSDINLDGVVDIAVATASDDSKSVTVAMYAVTLQGWSLVHQRKLEDRKSVV